MTKRDRIEAAAITAFYILGLDLDINDQPVAIEVFRAGYHYALSEMRSQIMKLEETIWDEAA